MIGYFYCSGFGKKNTEQSCCLNCLQIPSRVRSELLGSGWQSAGSGPGTSSRLTGHYCRGRSVAPSTCLRNNSGKWFFPPRATLVQKLLFVSTVTHCKFRMSWVSDTHTTHSCKQLPGGELRLEVKGRVGTRVMRPVFCHLMVHCALSREETVSW